VIKLFLQELRPFILVYSFLTFFLFAIFAAIALKLGLLFCKEELQCQILFQCDKFFQKLHPLEHRKFAFIFFAIFAAFALKLGKELQFQFTFRCD
jgi:hypothetical protein